MRRGSQNSRKVLSGSPGERDGRRPKKKKKGCFCDLNKSL